VGEILWPVAKDVNGNLTSISEATRDSLYYCPACGSKFIPRLGAIKQHHFAHLVSNPQCGGESGYHLIAKYLLAHHLESHRLLKYNTRCSKCHEIITCTKKITEVQIEKGVDSYRPDLLIKLNDDSLIYGEIVYKNPLAEKLEDYKRKNATLLAWFIDGQVVKVPKSQHWSWKYAPDLTEKGTNRGILYLISDFIPFEHICNPETFKPFADVNVHTITCWRCQRPTKVVSITNIWCQYGGSAKPFGETDYDRERMNHDILWPRRRDTPQELINKINLLEDTKLFEDRSQTAGFYIANHCQYCSAIQGDWYLHMERVTEKTEPIRKKVEFELTKWEKKHFLEVPESESGTN
jgi:predicted RNA-binding Zn-ribbon protein involved in translation (DUF1610 family)